MEYDNGRRILAMDIGGGTQDIVIYEEGKSPENFIQLVLPSPTVIVAHQLEKATKAKAGVHLTGTLMGGGRSVRALKNHLKAGLPVTARKEAAQTIKDDLEEVIKMGIQLKDFAPEGFRVVETKDVDLKSLKQALELFYVELPREVAVAVQDHGEAPIGESNRHFRFEHWRKFIREGGKIAELAYETPPKYLTRMKAVQKTVPGALVMDTCSAAVWGSFGDEVIKKEQKKGVVVVNIGNQHTFAAQVIEDRICGLFEHHTKMVDSEKLSILLDKFCRRELTNEEIFQDGGHGCYIASDAPSGFDFVGVTGPRRHLAEGLGFHMVNPHGNMMMTGCFGLIEAVKSRS